MAKVAKGIQPEVQLGSTYEYPQMAECITVKGSELALCFKTSRINPTSRGPHAKELTDFTLAAQGSSWKRESD